MEAWRDLLSNFPCISGGSCTIQSSIGTLRTLRLEELLFLQQSGWFYFESGVHPNYPQTFFQRVDSFGQDFIQETIGCIPNSVGPMVLIVFVLGVVGDSNSLNAHETRGREPHPVVSQGLERTTTGRMRMNSWIFATKLCTSLWELPGALNFVNYCGIFTPMFGDDEWKIHFLRCSTQHIISCSWVLRFVFLFFLGVFYLALTQEVFFSHFEIIIWIYLENLKIILRFLLQHHYYK